MRELGAEIKRLEAELAEIEAALDELATRLPNVPDPAGAGRGDRGGRGRSSARSASARLRLPEPRDHVELGTALGLIDMEQAAEASGSRFAYLLGDLVLVELALVRFALDPARAGGVRPGRAAGARPRAPALYGTGFFPAEREMIYEVPRDELFLVGTSEVSLAALHAGEILAAGELPLPLRRDLDLLPARGRRGRQGHPRDLPRPPVRQGRDVLVLRAGRVASPSTRACSAIQERILSALEIPYRVVDIPVGDLGAPAARKFDCEAWIPSQERYREVTSTSNTTDYQARRLDARYRPEPEAPPEHVHTDQRHRGRDRPHADRADREPPGRRRRRHDAGRRWWRRARRRAAQVRLASALVRASPARSPASSS